MYSATKYRSYAFLCFKPSSVGWRKSIKTSNFKFLKIIPYGLVSSFQDTTACVPTLCTFYLLMLYDEWKLDLSRVSKPKYIGPCFHWHDEPCRYGNCRSSICRYDCLMCSHSIQYLKNLTIVKGSRINGRELRAKPPTVCIADFRQPILLHGNPSSLQLLNLDCSSPLRNSLEGRIPKSVTRPKTTIIYHLPTFEGRRSTTSVDIVASGWSLYASLNPHLDLQSSVCEEWELVTDSYTHSSCRNWEAVEPFRLCNLVVVRTLPWILANSN